MPGGGLPPYARRFFGSGQPAALVGGGALGGKAEGLLRARDLAAARARAVPGVVLEVPSMVVVGTSVFEDFLRRNDLVAPALEGRDEATLRTLFRPASLPDEVTGDLWSLAREVRTPLAVRSSSLLEDAAGHPFAGVYATKMIPNHHADPETRFRRLMDALRCVYVSVFTSDARAYARRVGRDVGDERMGVIIQEVVGRRRRERFYPDLSGVARSWNAYPWGDARPEDGVVLLALGLGRTIVEGESCWSFSPTHPAQRPSGAPRDLLQATQSAFWAVRMAEPPVYDPLSETEYLVHEPIMEAEEDGVLGGLASTYDPQSDRIVPGVSRRGPRVLDFAPVLGADGGPLTAAVRGLLEDASSVHGGGVEIEFAAAHEDGEWRLRLLQMRALPTAVPGVEVTPDLLAGPRVVVSSDRASGHGRRGGLVDIVYARPEAFDPRHTRALARDFARVNADLVADGRESILIGFGRWGTADPWLGIPVDWASVSSARALVECTRPGFEVDPSQGSHFFHNLAALGVAFLTVPHGRPGGVDWAWLDGLPAITETPLLRHVRAPDPLEVIVDGRARRGLVRR